MKTGFYRNNNDNSFVIILDEKIINELGWLENDKLDVDITKICFGEYEKNGILLYQSPESENE